MIVSHTILSDVFLIDTVPMQDERGFFARTWDSVVAEQHGLLPHFDYMCVSGNTKMHTLRGMHYQKLPHGETKLVRCTKGSIFDVVVDLRSTSPTFRQWISANLSATNHHALYIPAGCAHGFLTLEDHTEVLYGISGAYVPAAAVGLRYDDPRFGIVWPEKPQVIAPRDASFPLSED
jgi:dTDP-4-dehydrorhamnose 3,5-epimerase